MGADPDRTHSNDETERRNPKAIGSMLLAIKVSMAIHFSFFIAGFLIWGFLTPSAALLGDSLHNGLHCLISLAGYFGISSPSWVLRHTSILGRERLQALASFTIAILLLVTTFTLWTIGSERIAHPQEIVGSFMMIMAGLAILGNIFEGYLMYKYRSNPMVKGVLFDIFVDMLTSIAVIVSGSIIFLSGFYRVDGIAAILIGFVSLWGAYTIGKSAVQILLKETPRNGSHT